MNSSFSINGRVYPEMAFGTWKVELENAKSVIGNAINCGFRYFDLAAAYGNGLEVVSELKKCGIARESLIISDKLWNTKRGFDKATRAVKSSLKRMGLDYLDMMLIHWPASKCEYSNWEEINLDTWKALEDLYCSGVLKAIGVCNFHPHHLDIIMERAEIKPMLNQIEYHPGFTQNKVVGFCKDNGILVEAWSPLGNGKVLTNTELVNLANKYNKSVAQVCLKWCIQNGVLPVTKACSIGHMRENRDIFDFEISEPDMEMINCLDGIALSGMEPDKINIFV